MRVIADGFRSSWSIVVSGVPQGSVLGPLLYFLYINDIPNLITSKVKLFTDDMKLWHIARSKNDENIISQDLKTLEKYSEKWLLKFNAVKCQ